MAPPSRLALATALHPALVRRTGVLSTCSGRALSSEATSAPRSAIPAAVPSHFPSNSPSKDKLTGYDFYRSLGSPRHALAPMVAGSELAWRILSRSPFGGGGQDAPPLLCYSPMIEAIRLVESKPGSQAEKSMFDFAAGEEGSLNPIGEFGVSDRPLIVQFAANDPAILLRAAKMVEERCDAVDINLGCPQLFAKARGIGAFLMEDWDKIHSLIHTLNTQLSVPVTVKLRCFDTVERTVEYARMCEAAGAQLLTVHGRTRYRPGNQATFLADWTKIREVKRAVRIPVLSNGNILDHGDIERCLEETGCDGVMSAEGNLHNPAIFLPSTRPPCTTLALRYLYIVRSLTTQTSHGALKRHLFDLLWPIFARGLPAVDTLRDELARARTVEKCERIVKNVEMVLREELGIDLEAERWDGREREGEGVPWWRAQPKLRALVAGEGAITR